MRPKARTAYVIRILRSCNYEQYCGLKSWAIRQFDRMPSSKDRTLFTEAVFEVRDSFPESKSKEE